MMKTGRITVKGGYYSELLFDKGMKMTRWELKWLRGAYEMTLKVLTLRALLVSDVSEKYFSSWDSIMKTGDTS